MQLHSLVMVSAFVFTTGLLSCGDLAAATPAGESPSTNAVAKEVMAPRAEATTNAAASGTNATPAANGCLDCHGPFEKLIAASTKYVAPSGEKTSPHRYVPHDSKLEKDIPECSHCHTAHPLSPLPSKGAIDLSKLSVQWCYDTCHHQKDLKSCKECH
jgi:hypothetical protein